MGFTVKCSPGLKALTELLEKQGVLNAKSVVATLSLCVTLVLVNILGKPPGKTEGSKKSKIKEDSEIKVEINQAFFMDLWKLVKIIVPGVLSPEAGVAVGVSGLLVARTYFDLVILQLTTRIEGQIVQRNSTGFVGGIIDFLAVMVPVSCVNSLLKYGQNELALRFRKRLTDHLMKIYMSGFIYYQISNLDNRIANPGQLLTQDVERFCKSVADLYSNVSKPLLDIFLFAGKLRKSIGSSAPAIMGFYLLASGLLLTRMRRPTGKFTASLQHLEGDYRFLNSRLQTHAEEVAFYGGNTKETATIIQAFTNLMSMTRRTEQFRFAMAVVDSVIAKYGATVVGWLVVSHPFLKLTSPAHLGATHSEIYHSYHSSGRMMLKMASALGALVLSGRELTRLAGFTHRIINFIEVLEDLKSGKYSRTLVQIEPKKTQETENLNDDTVSQKKDTAADSDFTSKASSVQENAQPRPTNILSSSGIVVIQDHVIHFQQVPLFTPNGDLLIKELTFKVVSGMNVVVAGPNGCGKSSLFRTLGGLWPLRGGKLTKPAADQLFYVPQRPYLTIGTLRDQIIYPHTAKRMESSGFSDDHLSTLLREVRLEYIAEREHGWDAVCDWADILSGGEKQRVAMARLLYHKPQFAILDECTSAVSVDVEGAMYTKCREEGISLFTVSHRKSLWRYHEFVLRFDGHGGYEFKAIDDSEEVFGS